MTSTEFSVIKHGDSVTLIADNFILVTAKRGLHDSECPGRVFWTASLFDTSRQEPVVFSDAKHSTSPMNTNTPWLHLYALENALTMFSLGEDATDEEYFKDYTRAQLRWRNSSRRQALENLREEFVTRYNLHGFNERD